MDAEIKENLAAMSCEFQDSDNEDYSPVTKDIENQNAEDAPEEEPLASNSPPSAIPLITEHIISVSIFLKLLGKTWVCSIPNH